MTSTQRLIPYGEIHGHRHHHRTDFALLIVVAIVAAAVLIAIGVGVAFAAPTGTSEVDRTQEQELTTGDGDPWTNSGQAGALIAATSRITDELVDAFGSAVVENPAESVPGSGGPSPVTTPSTTAPNSAPVTTPATTPSAPPATVPPTTQASPSTPSAPTANATNGLPPDSYWDAMAMCETGGNWQMTGSRFSGGVGFANSTWNAYGGQEFAPNAGMASRDQQIVVANRVATQGYGSVRAVGYSAWGCTSRVGYP